MDVVLAQLLRIQYDLTHRDEKGATAVEYGLLVGLIAAVIIALVLTLGTKIQGLFQTVVTSLGG